MKRTMLMAGSISGLLLVVMGLSLWSGPGVSSADGGPHGGFRNTTGGLPSQCAACHRAHTAVSDGGLLVESDAYHLCLDCHNGQGSQLDVMTGTRLDTGGILNGGGFQSLGADAVTSVHPHDPADGEVAPWGYNVDPFNPTQNTGENNVTNTNLGGGVECVSCHDPHGSSNYRLLKTNIGGNPVKVQAFFGGKFVADEGQPGLGPLAPVDKYTHDYYGSDGDMGATSVFDATNNTLYRNDGSLVAADSAVSSVCGACHTAYPSPDAGVAYTSSDNVTHYRHKTEAPYTEWSAPWNNGNPVPNNPETNPIAGFPALRLASNAGQTNTIVTCLTCHRSHGTATLMTGWAVPKPSVLVANGLPGFNGSDGQPGLNPNIVSPAQEASDNISTLLYTDNRGMCEACHQWPN